VHAIQPDLEIRQTAIALLFALCTYHTEEVDHEGVVVAHRQAVVHSDASGADVALSRLLPMSQVLAGVSGSMGNLCAEHPQRHCGQPARCTEAG
jgi:hypothetical protein